MTSVNATVEIDPKGNDYSRLDCSDNVMDTYTTNVNSDTDDDYTSKVKHDGCQNDSNDLVDDKTEMCRYYTVDVNGDIDTSLSDETESFTNSVFSIDKDNCWKDNDKTCRGNIAIVETGLESIQTNGDLYNLNEDNKSINREIRTNNINNLQYNLICNYCGSQFESVAKISFHLKTHTHRYQDKGKYVYACSICKTDWDVLSNLQDHMFVHTTVRYRKCSYCTKRFLHQDELNKHIVQMHTEKNSKRRRYTTGIRNETYFVDINGTDTDIDCKLPTSSKETNYINEKTRTQLRHMLTRQCVQTRDIPVTDSHAADIATTTDSRTDDIAPITDSGRADVKPAYTELKRLLVASNVDKCHMSMLEKHDQETEGITKDLAAITPSSDIHAGTDGEVINKEVPSSTDVVSEQLSILEKHDQEGITKGIHLAASKPSISDIGTHGEVINKEVPTSTDVVSEQPIESFRKNMNTCNYCGDTFDSVAKFSFHLKTHRAKYLYRCNICRTDCDIYSKLKNHMLNMHNNITGEFKCMYCPQGFSERYRLDVHMERKHPENNTDNSLKDVNRDRNNDSMGNHPTTIFQESIKKSEDLTRDQVVHEHDICNSNTEMDVFLEDYMKRFSLDIETACIFCDDRLSSLSTLRIHLKQHVRKYKGQMQFVYQCNICKRNFENQNLLANHRQVHYGVNHTGTTNSRFLCGFCQKVVKTANEAKKHLQTHISIIKYFQCEVCSRTFADHTSLIQHTDDHDKDKDKNVKDKAEDKDPISNSSNGSPTCTCDLCGKVLIDGRLFIDAHILRHLCMKPYKCQICHAQFYDATRLRTHSYKHTGVRVFRCIRCIKSFGNSYTLRYHMMQKHGEMAFMCTLCPKMFLDSQALNKHLIDHRRMQNVCKICGKVFTQKNRLQLHMTSHSDVRSIQCKVCRKTFKTVKHLQKHSQIHRPKEDTAIMCEICGKSYQRRSLKQHKKFHSKKKFNCDICSKTFTLKHHLRNHLLSHDGARNYVCDICGYKFKMAHHMRSHMKLHASSVGE